MSLLLYLDHLDHLHQDVDVDLRNTPPALKTHHSLIKLAGLMSICINSRWRTSCFQIVPSGLQWKRYRREIEAWTIANQVRILWITLGWRR